MRCAGVRAPSLRLIQALAVCSLRRDSAGAIQGLQMLHEVCEDLEAIDSLRQLEINLSPEERFWLGNLLGDRKSLQRSAA